MSHIVKTFDRRDAIPFLIALFFIVLQVGLDLKIPEFMEKITTIVQTPGSTTSDVWNIGTFMLLTAFLSLVSSVVVGFFASRLGSSFSAGMREKVFDKVGSFSLQEMNRFSTSSLITRSTNDITQLEVTIILGMQIIIKAPIMATWAILKIAGKQWQWTIVTATTVLLLFVLVLIVIQFVIPKFELIQKLLDRLTNVTRENITGIRVVRAYNAEKYETKKFQSVNQQLMATNLFTNRVMALLVPILTTVMGGLNLAIYWVGAYLIQAAGTPEKLPLFSEMVVYSSYAMQVVTSFVMMVAVFILVPRARVSADRINEVLSTNSLITEGTKSGNGGIAEGEVSFQNVSFRYPDAEEYVLKNISFDVKKGETVAFIGSTGSGKSTLLNLIPRLYDVTEGAVLVDGINVKEYRQKDLYNKIGYVSQKAVLFSGTISSNVAFGEKKGGKPSETDVQEAIRIAQGTEFVENLEDRYASRVAQGGSNLSGGQKQRIAIARAVARKPEFYLFDDSFSALDFETDRKLRELLKKETAGVTTFIVAQRIGTIRDADKIIVLDEGKMAGVGTHETLMQTSDVYREIAFSQFAEEDLIDA